MFRLCAHRFLMLMLLFIFLLPLPGLASSRSTMMVWEASEGFSEQYTEETDTFYRGDPHMKAPKGRHATAMEMFSGLHPDIDLEYHSAWVDDSGLNNALMAGSPGYDMLLDNSADWTAMYKAGLIIDLASYPPLMESLKTWPNLLNLFGDGEHLFAVPYKMRPIFYYVNDTVYSAMGLNVDGE